MKFTNNANIPLPLAAWLLHDDYDYIDDPKYISATTLIKPTKIIIMERRVDSSTLSMDLEDLIPSALGRTIHMAIEAAWLAGAWKKLSLLTGVPEGMLDRIIINPKKEDLKDDSVPLYMEQREFRKIAGYTIGGKYDLIADGLMHDYKSTSAYSWLYGTRDDDYALQGSIYRWLNPKLVTENFIRICFIFTDWQKAAAKSNPNYPQHRIQHKDIPLLSLERTEAWIKNKIKELEANIDLPEEQMIPCSDEDLWFPEPKFRYFKDPSKTDGRATRVFGTLAEAQSYQASKGGVGTIVIEKGLPKRCLYCKALSICKQCRTYYNADGTPVNE